MSESQGPMAGLSEHELSEIRMLIEERTGICFDESRERFFSTRVREHLRAKNFANGTDLLRAMRKTNVEYEALLERLLTQETSFFRYPAVYDTFEKRVLPELHVKKFWKNPRTLRVWSAGCSTGEEPYSIAITVADALSFADAWNVEILATDVGRQALKQAERGVYSGRCLASVTPAQLAAHFTAVEGGHQLKPRLKKMVTFAQMNLASAVYVGRMDLIFCMNVLIYFSEERRRSLVQRFYDSLEPGGYLFLGHSESISKMPVKFQAIVLNDCILYRKPTAEEFRNPNSSRRDAREHARPRSRRNLPPGSLGAPAIFAGVRQRASGSRAAARRPRTLVHRRAYPHRNLRRLRLPALLGSCRQARARLPICDERHPGRRPARPADGIPLRRNFRPRNRFAGDQRHRRGNGGRHRRFQGTLPLRVSGRAGALELWTAAHCRAGHRAACARGSRRGVHRLLLRRAARRRRGSGRDSRIFPSGSARASPGRQRLPDLSGRKQQSGRGQSPLPRDSHREGFRRASRAQAPERYRAPCGRLDRPPARFRNRAIRSGGRPLPRLRRCLEKDFALPVGRRIRNARRSRFPARPHRGIRAVRGRRTPGYAINR